MKAILKKRYAAEDAIEAGRNVKKQATHVPVVINHVESGSIVSGGPTNAVRQLEDELVESKARQDTQCSSQDRLIVSLAARKNLKRLSLVIPSRGDRFDPQVYDPSSLVLVAKLDQKAADCIVHMCPGIEQLSIHAHAMDAETAAIVTFLLKHFAATLRNVKIGSLAVPSLPPKARTNWMELCGALKSLPFAVSVELSLRKGNCPPWANLDLSFIKTFRSFTFDYPDSFTDPLFLQVLSESVVSPARPQLVRLKGGGVDLKQLDALKSEFKEKLTCIAVDVTHHTEWHILWRLLKGLPLTAIKGVRIIGSNVLPSFLWLTGLACFRLVDLELEFTNFNFSMTTQDLKLLDNPPYELQLFTRVIKLNIRLGKLDGDRYSDSLVDLLHRFKNLKWVHIEIDKPQHEPLLNRTQAAHKVRQCLILECRDFETRGMLAIYT